jgi:16S rRNA processing protein RimM
MTPWADMVSIGRAVKPQGRHGEIVIQPLSDRPDRFETLSRVYVPGPAGETREMAVTSSWPHKGRWVLKLSGVDSIDDAEKLRNLELRIPEEELEALPPGSYYHHQLRGVTVVDESGRTIGVVHDLLETGAAIVLVIRDGERETLIPLAEEFVRSVDVAARRAVVRVPEVIDAQR